MQVVYATYLANDILETSRLYSASQSVLKQNSIGITCNGCQNLTKIEIVQNKMDGSNYL